MVDQQKSTITDERSSTMLYMKTVGDRLRFRRKREKLSLEALGKAAKMTKQGVSAIEKGTTKQPEAENILELAQRLQTTSQWLMTGEDPLVDSDGTRIARGEISPPANWSQLPRPDFEKIAASVTVLREYLKLEKLPPSRINDPILLEAAYEVVEDFGAPVLKSNVIDLAQRVRDRLLTEGGDGQGSAVHGTSKKAGAAK